LCYFWNQQPFKDVLTATRLNRFSKTFSELSSDQSRQQFITILTIQCPVAICYQRPISSRVAAKIRSKKFIVFSNSNERFEVSWSMKKLKLKQQNPTLIIHCD
jgi:hypothetical protein